MADMHAMVDAKVNATLAEMLEADALPLDVKLVDTTYRSYIHALLDARLSAKVPTDAEDMFQSTVVLLVNISAHLISNLAERGDVKTAAFQAQRLVNDLAVNLSDLLTEAIDASRHPTQTPRPN